MLLVLALQPARSAAIATSHPRYGVSRHSAVRASGAMDWLRRNEPARRGREAAGEDDASERGEARVFDAANDVDTIDFGGAVGGGTLTRESIASAGRTISPAIAAEQALQAACDDCGSLEPEKAAELLQREDAACHRTEAAPMPRTAPGRLDTQRIPITPFRPHSHRRQRRECPPRHRAARPQPRTNF